MPKSVSFTDEHGMDLCTVYIINREYVGIIIDGELYGVAKEIQVPYSSYDISG